jgi:hypothetical protein
MIYSQKEDYMLRLHASGKDYYTEPAPVKTADFEQDQGKPRCI